MRYNPHPYQSQAIQFLLDHPKAALFLDMGLGKTSVTLTALSKLLYDYFTVSKVLVIAPLRVARDTWPEELDKWDHLQLLDYAVAVGDRKKRINALKADKPITIINRENLDWLVHKSGHKWDFDTVVIDEMSSFKNRDTNRWRALNKVMPWVGRIVGLTGTPAPKGLIDLWAQYRLLDGGERLGRFIGEYRGAYFTPGRRKGYKVYDWQLAPGGEQQIYARIKDITLSMKGSDYLELPALTRVSHSVKLNPTEMKQYKALESELALEVAGQEITAINAAALAGKLSQMASGRIYTDAGETLTLHERKLDALEDLYEAANGQPLLVAYWFKHDKDAILGRFPQARALESSGDMQAWNRGEIPLALIHPASAGHGLNLQAGGHLLVWYSLTWNLELYQQTNARLYRQGQTQPVTITHLVTEGTIDTRVVSALDSKAATQDNLIEAVKATLQAQTHPQNQPKSLSHLLSLLEEGVPYVASG